MELVLIGALVAIIALITLCTIWFFCLHSHYFTLEEDFTVDEMAKAESYFPAETIGLVKHSGEDRGKKHLFTTGLLDDQETLEKKEDTDLENTLKIDASPSSNLHRLCTVDSQCERLDQHHPSVKVLGQEEIDGDDYFAEELVNTLQRTEEEKSVDTQEAANEGRPRVKENEDNVKNEMVKEQAEKIRLKMVLRKFPSKIKKKALGRNTSNSFPQRT